MKFLKIALSCFVFIYDSVAATTNTDITDKNDKLCITKLIELLAFNNNLNDFGVFAR
jgi:hypothetical protein